MHGFSPPSAPPGGEKIGTILRELQQFAVGLRTVL